ncbi:MAG: class I SAM-dependent methyltransferase [Chitinivibrionales bacterium]|nr:class I SAM-dependent methyltransferase [Chitinivibrionales bacterium]
MNSYMKKYTESNRDAWNEVAPLHQKFNREKLDQLFKKPGALCLCEDSIEPLRKLPIKGKDIIHLCCNNGRELLSLKNMGAGRCVGVDISDAAIEEAEARAKSCSIGCEYIRSDVYELPAALSNRFDLVFITIGCLCWMPDIAQFMRIAHSLLRKGGQVFIHEVHPFTEMLPIIGEPSDDCLRIIHPYFNPEPFVDTSSMDYYGQTRYVAKTHYTFVHTLSAIFQGLINAGFVITHFSEYENDISNGFLQQEELNAKIPLSFILIGGTEGLRTP